MLNGKRDGGTTDLIFVILILSLSLDLTTSPESSTSQCSDSLHTAGIPNEGLFPLHNILPSCIP